MIQHVLKFDQTLLEIQFLYQFFVDIFMTHAEQFNLENRREL